MFEPVAPLPPPDSARMTLQVALVGYGLAGATFHAPLITATPGLRLASIVTRDATRRAAAAARHPGVRLVDTADALLAGPDRPDLVVVASPSGTHASLARATLAAGCHVVVDKPVAGTYAEAAGIGQLARERGRFAIPFQNRRWDGDFLTLRKLLDEGTLGQVYRFESRFERWRAEPRPRWCRPGARAAVEGIVYDIGSHLVDQALVAFGPVERVFATLRRVRPALQVEDDAVLVLEHATGVHSHLYLSASAAHPGARFRVSGTRGGYVKYGLDGQEAALAAGVDPASAQWGAEPRSAWGTLAVGGARAPVPGLAGGYARFYPAVAAALRNEGAVPVRWESAAAVLRVLEAVFTAADSGALTEVAPS